MKNNVIYIDFSKKHKKNQSKTSSSFKLKQGFKKFGSLRSLISSIKCFFYKIKAKHFNKRNSKRNNSNII